MPTPVSAARQCLTDEAARALDDAVAVARRRSHAQTTSLHAVSALLALPSSTLREACARARSCAYSHRLQFRALELSVGVALDRLPSTKGGDEPPVSNSLMAAIKRSQANQRRHPESFHLYQLQQSQVVSLSCVKVELKYFILSILDDPIVSRVFGEAGFRSYDVKLAVIHPPPPPRPRCPPLFLCNLDPGLDSSRPGFGFDENCRRIGEVLGREKGRNPLLVGVCAKDALLNFEECVKKGSVGKGVMGSELCGLSMVSIEKEICDYVGGVDGGEEMMGLKFEEVGVMVEECGGGGGGGVVVNLGELKCLVGEKGGEKVSFLVSKLTNMVEVYGRKFWLIGSAASHETYSRLLTRFPMVEKDWDMHILPITSSRPSIDGFFSKPSLMGSFIPFGGFFPTLSDLKNPLSSTGQSMSRCHLCNDKYNQEVSAMLKGESANSVADQYSTNLPSWLQMADLDTTKGLNPTKAKHDRSTLNEKMKGLQEKWNDMCRQIHRTRSFGPQPVSQALCTEGFRLGDRDKSQSEESSLNECSPRIPIGPENNFPKPESAKSSHPSDCISSAITSVTTDLGLGTLYASTSLDPKKPKGPDHKERVQHFSGSLPAHENASAQIARTSSCSELRDPKDYKSILKFLAQKVSWQNEAIRAISETVSCCRTGNGRRRGSNLKGDIWLSFVGPDKVGKMKIAAALADVVFGCRENLISVDFLSFYDSSSYSNSIFDHQKSDDHDLKFRGKTVVDYIAMELMNKPHSVVFLENIDKADLQAQNSLSHAIKTGKFQDSRGKEISINNMIFVTTSKVTGGNNNDSLSQTQNVEFLEESILRAKHRKLQILIETSNPASMNKRKLIGETSNQSSRSKKAVKTFLDLNLPLEDTEENYDSDSISENSEAWLEDLFDQTDEIVVFKPFDFDGLAEKVRKEIKANFEKTIGPEVLLEIEPEVMGQLLAAAWLSDEKNAISDWIEQVLYTSFAAAKQRYSFTSQSVLRLVGCEGRFVEAQALGVCLPEKIILN